MSKIYISGQISGLPLEEARRKFDTAEESLKAKGYEVVNPMKNGIPHDAAWELHVAMDIVLLMSCESIYMLPCWIFSRGATLEKNFADLTGKTVVYEEEPRNEDIKRAIFDALGVSFFDITGRDRQNKYVFARMIYAFLCREQGDKIADIAQDIKHNHSTVMYYLRKYADDIKTTHDFKEMVRRVEEQLKK